MTDENDGQPSLTQMDDEVAVIDDGGFRSLCETTTEFLPKSGYFIGSFLITRAPGGPLIARSVISIGGSQSGKVMCWQGATEVINVMISFERGIVL